MPGHFLIWRKDCQGIKQHLKGERFKILLQLISYLHASKANEVRYTFRFQARGHSRFLAWLFCSLFINCGDCATQARSVLTNI